MMRARDHLAARALADTNNWVFTTPPLLLALEAGQTAIFLQSRLNEASLYQAIFFQLFY